MVSLLVTFFILLMTFSSLEKFDAFQVRGDLTGTTGTLQNSNGSTAAEPPEWDLMSAMDAVRGADTPHSRPTEELLENLDEMGQKLTSEHVELDLKDVKDGLVVHFGERASFAPGSAQVPPALRQALVELGRTLEHYPFVVTVEGFTDGAFLASPTYPTAEALGCARAVAAAEVMVANSGLSPRVVQVAGPGAERPVAPNDTPIGRARNRRVEVRIVSLSKTRAAALGESAR